MKNRILLVLLLILGFALKVGAQKFNIPSGKKFEKVKFELINNLIVVPLEVNGVTLKFILDSGVSKPILFNISHQDSIPINEVSELSIRGLGTGEPIKALRSKNNTIRLGDAVNFNQSLFVILDRTLNFSTSLGISVHGIIGYDIFRDFVVEVNYISEVLKLYPPEKFIHKPTAKKEVLPLAVIHEKAYVRGAIIKKDDVEVPVKLLVDTGNGDALWLFRNLDVGIEVPEENYEDFLGEGLSGSVFGKRTRLKGIRLGRFYLKDAKAAFPYKESFHAISDFGNRNGSLGGEVLKRFNLIFDYSRNQLILAKNSKFKTPFQFNLAGIDLQHNGMRMISEQVADANEYLGQKNLGNVQLLLQNSTKISLVPEIIISSIRSGSPAEVAGLQEGDVILAVNGKRVHGYRLQEILHMMNAKKGKRVKLLIERYSKDVLFSFVLEDVFKQKKP